MEPLEWLYSVLYMASSLMLAQQIVLRASGMSYATFMGNVRSAIFRK